MFEQIFRLEKLSGFLNLCVGFPFTIPFRFYLKKIYIYIYIFLFKKSMDSLTLKHSISLQI